MERNETLSEKLIKFGLGLQYKDIPNAALLNAKHHILDVIGVILASSRTESAVTIKNTIDQLGGVGQSTVIGSKKRFPAPYAALANATMAHTPDFDDTHGKSIVHPSSVILPTTLAIAESQESSGKAILAAAIAGYEIILRMGMAAPGKLHEVGFHPTGVCGIFGATLIAGKLKGMDGMIIRNAMGICGSQASGILEFLSDGSSVKRLHPGWACLSGIIATILAEQGMTGPSTVLEGRFGFYKTHLGTKAYNLDVLTKDLGKKWEVIDISYKPYPCCHFLPAFIDCVKSIRKSEVFDTAQIEEIECIIAPGQAELVCMPLEEKRNPQTPYDGKFSLPYVMAVTLLRNKCVLSDFTEDAIHDRQVLDLTKKFRFTLSDKTGYPGTFPGWVKVRLKNGKVFEHREKTNRGGPENPLSEKEIFEKFEENGQLVLNHRKVRAIREHVMNLDNIRDITVLTNMLRF